MSFPPVPLILGLLYLISSLKGSRAQNLTTVKYVGTVLFNSLTNETRYNKWAIPTLHEDVPLEVLVRAYVYHLRIQETSKLDLSMQILLELSWEDPRLKYNEELTGLKVITGDFEQLEKIWVPHVIFSNEKDSQITDSKSRDDFFTLLPSGLVILTTRVGASLYCYLNLGNFPFDQQDCHLTMESWRHNSHLLQLAWDENIELDVESISNTLTEFNVLSAYCEENKEDILERMNSGEEILDSTNSAQFYSSLTIRMKLERSHGHYFLNYYLPSVLLVIISWVSFWLEPSAIPGRVVLGSATMLTFIQLCWSAQINEKSSQFMANDVWALTCTAFIFLSLAEFAFVNTIDRKGAGGKLELKKLSSKYIIRGGVDTAAGRAKLRRASSCPSSPEIRRHFAKNTSSKSKTLKDLQKVSNSLSPPVPPKDRRKSWIIPDNSPLFTMTPQEIAIWIDNKSKIIFPISFCIFNMAYWLPLVFVDW